MEKINKEELGLLKKYISFQTISAENNKDIDIATTWLMDLIKIHHPTNILKLKTTHGYPVIYSSFIIDKSKPTILFYGHYDVQPANEEGWNSPPFQITQKGAYWYGRGVSDNKCQNFGVLLAIFELLRDKKQLNYNIKLLLETSEEIGSKDLDKSISANKKLFGCDLVVGVDGETTQLNTPVIYHSARGIVYYRLLLTHAEKEYHSGYYGGIIQNPSLNIAKFIGQFKIFFNKNIKVGSQTTWDIHTIQLGSESQGIKTSIPNKTRIDFSYRISPDQSIIKIREETEAFVKKFCKKEDIKFSLEPLISIDPIRISPNSQECKIVEKALNAVFQKKVMYKKFPATLPIFSYVTQILKKPFIFTSFGPPKSNSHSANERFYIPHYFLLKKFIYNLLES